MSSAIAIDRVAVPVALRRAAAWTAAVAALLVLALGIRNEGRTRSSNTDRLLDKLIENWVPDRSHGFSLVERLGDPRTAAVLAVLLAVVALLVRRRRLAVLALAGPGLTGVATTGLKPLFDRTLDGNLAYPSGHTAALTSLALVAALLLVSLVRPGPAAAAALVTVIAVGAGATMAVSLTSLDVHYPTDTIGGFGTAVAVVLTCGLLIDRLADARERRRRGSL